MQAVHCQRVCYFLLAGYWSSLRVITRCVRLARAGIVKQKGQEASVSEIDIYRASREKRSRGGVREGKEHWGRAKKVSKERGFF